MHLHHALLFTSTNFQKRTWALSYLDVKTAYKKATKIGAFITLELLGNLSKAHGSAHEGLA